MPLPTEVEAAIAEGRFADVAPLLDARSLQVTHDLHFELVILFQALPLDGF
jgi:hypothetical protein